MKNLLAALLFVVLIAISPAGLARPGEPMQSPQQVTLVSGANGGPSMGSVHDTIIQAGAKRGWHVVSDNPGELVLHNLVRGKHQVDVKVTYDTHSVSIAYVSSVDLDYSMEGGVAFIHPKYNEWVHLLLKDIAGKTPR